MQINTVSILRKVIAAVVMAFGFRLINQLVYLILNQYGIWDPLFPQVLVDVPALLLIIFFNSWWRKRLEKRETMELGKRYLQHFIPLAGVVFWMVILADNLGFNWFNSAEFLNYNEVVREAWVGVFATAVYAAADLGKFYLERYRDSLAELERFQRENVQTRLATLKSQINPHFLFNSLNTLSSLIHEDQERASHFVRQISKVYRHILESRDQDLISLEEELSILESYSYLMQTRFEENIRIELKVDASYHAYRLPPMAVQMLLENAIKHNVISKKYPLLLEVTTSGSYLMVRNNLQRKTTLEPSTKVGLNNIKSRYQFLTQTPVIIEESATHFSVKLPLLPPA